MVRPLSNDTGSSGLKGNVNGLIKRITMQQTESLAHTSSLNYKGKKLLAMASLPDVEVCAGSTLPAALFN